MTNTPYALVTGASSGIGLAISRTLIANNIHVYGIGRSFDTPIVSELFTPIVCDLTKTGELTNTINKLKKDIPFSYVIHNAGVGYFGPHEEQNPAKIHEMTCVNLEVPMLLTNLLLRDIKACNGTFIFISSVTAHKSNTHGCAYGATKAGLSSFARSLFDEVRKYGVKVVIIHPDMTQSNFYRNANFTACDDLSTSLIPEDIANAVEAVIKQRDGLVINEITLVPQYHRIERKS
ncbi:MAG: SDR family oxidoreductase [Lachnospiraceae bacterium]|nr:SDR family oxidoreductase [Lachnospiraceae bacterium]